MKHALLATSLALLAAAAPAATVLSTDYPSIQAAIDANPGGTIHVPAGEHVIDQTLMLTADGTTLEGPGTIIQKNPDSSIIRVQGATMARVTGLTLTRPQDDPITTQEGLTVRDSRLVEIDGVRVVDNKGPAGSIRVMDSPDTTIRDCTVLNYMFIGIEDRTGNDLYGFAFNSIDGSGIVIVNSPRILVANNRVIEEDIIATPELRDAHDLGLVVKKNETKGPEVPDAIWEQGRVPSNWQQGSGIYVGRSSGQLIGNVIVNAAQGMDIHSDHVIVANNIVDDAFMGMKSMHGSRNVQIIGNQFIRPGMWGICLSSGTSSRQAKSATETTPAVEPNVDGGHIIANNVITDFGHGSASWNWANAGDRSGIRLAWSDATPLSSVVITGNVLYDHGRDKIIVDGVAQVVPPRYLYAVYVTGENPQDFHFTGNMFHPGLEGISNVPLPE